MTTAFLRELDHAEDWIETSARLPVGIDLDAARAAVRRARERVEIAGDTAVAEMRTAVEDALGVVLADADWTNF